MAETAERSYRVIRAEDGRYAVQVTPNEENAPLTISGFKSEDEALASPSEIPNCDRCGGAVRNVVGISAARSPAT